MVYIGKLPQRFSDSKRQAVLALLATVVLLGCLQPAMLLSAGDTGIRGTAMLGPVQPGPERAGQSTEAPLRGSFLVFESGRKVGSFESDETGSFEISLPPGEYRIVPDKSTPIPFAHRQERTVIVPVDGYATVTLRFDSGMR